MLAADGVQVTGIVRRFTTGSKKVMHRHKAGLYMPVRSLPIDLSSERLLVCEGASDAIVAHDLGFHSIGRFSCSHGEKLIASILRSRQPTEVCIIADTGNKAELSCAQSLATTYRVYCRHVRLLFPHAKDLRAWRDIGANYDDIESAIQTSDLIAISLEVRSSR